MFTVHWKVWNESKQEWEFFKKKVNATTPPAAAQEITRSEKGAVIEKIKKA
jgi:hypothetical protein